MSYMHESLARKVTGSSPLKIHRPVILNIVNRFYIAAHQPASFKRLLLCFLKRGTDEGNTQVTTLCCRINPGPEPGIRFMQMCFIGLDKPARPLNDSRLLRWGQ